jgi:myosin heavy subunit
MADSGAGHWREQVAGDGRLMYYNARTMESTYVKPLELYTPEEVAEQAYEFYWVADAEHAWAPARKMGDGKFKMYESGASVSKRPSEVGPKIESIGSTKVLIADLVQLDDVNEASIIWLLYQRFKAERYFTAVGDILIAVNPFKRTDLFSEEQVKRYRGRVAGMTLPPHPYIIVDDAYKAIQDSGKNQSILISGESGAGKTFTVRVCLSYISKVAGSPTGVEKKVLGTNPILEAFGNAKTMRNDNSSRFGKFMQLYFNQRYEIIGCEIENYLLEKSRIADQQDGERNFHIFYYLTTLLPDDRKRLLMLGDAGDYRYLTRSSCFSGDTHSDVEEFNDAMKAFRDIGFPDEERDALFKVVSAVLNLGNIDFEETSSGGAQVSAAKNGFKHLGNAASLLGLPVDRLKAILTQNVSNVSGSEMVRAFTVHVAEQARDSLAKGLYGRLFDWLVQRLNKSMLNSATGFTPTRIGMVDIFGFEIFKQNSFEQLCINFANEKLQQMFNKHTFLLEEKTYREEGIAFDPVHFYDSQPLLDLLGLPVSGVAKMSVFQQLDEQTAMAKGTEEQFLAAVDQRHSSKTTTKHGELVQFFKRHRLKKKCFTIEHYAGPVQYNVSGWLAKNADKLHSNQMQAMKECSNPFVAALFESNKDARSTSQTTKFLSQLRELEKSVDATWPRFVRCVKPNQLKSSTILNGVESLQQLRFAGVFEAVSIRKQGFPFRETHEQFYKKCVCCRGPS